MLGAPRQGRDNEHRFPAAFAIVVGAALYAALPSSLTLGSRFAIPGLELATPPSGVGVQPAAIHTRDDVVANTVSRSGLL